jgi:hypothetical protein
MMQQGRLNITKVLKQVLNTLPCVFYLLSVLEMGKVFCPGATMAELGVDASMWTNGAEVK